MKRLRFAAAWTVTLVAVECMGCDSAHRPVKSQGRPFEGLTLRVGAIGDTAILDSIRTYCGEWEQSTGAKVLIEDQSLQPSRLGMVEVILFPGERMGDLRDANYLAQIPDQVPDTPEAGIEAAKGSVARSNRPLTDLVPVFRDRVSRYGSERLGLPLGGSALVLAYRRDGMISATMRQKAQEAGVRLEPPRTWEELDALVTLFHGCDWDGDGLPEVGLVVAFGDDKEGLANDVFLARAASLGFHPDHFAFVFDTDTMSPRITSPPFVEALNGLVKWKRHGPPKNDSFDAEAARASFRSGEAAFLIDRAEMIGHWTDPKTPIDVAVALLPGSSRVFDPARQAWQESTPPNQPSYMPKGGGWLAGVNAQTESKKLNAAVSFTAFLASPQTARNLQGDPTFPMLPTHTSDLGLGISTSQSTLAVDSGSWSKSVSLTLTSPHVVLGLRIHEAGAYLADLSQARRAALAGTPALEALQAASRAWSQRSSRLGEARQVWHHRRSLNRLATDPEPPPRQEK